MRHIFHGDHAAAGGFCHIGHLGQRSIAAVPHQVVRQQHRERFVTDHGLGTQHRVAQAECFGLRHKNGAYAFGQCMAHQLQLLELACALELLFQLIGLVEVVGDRVLVAIGDEDQRIATGLDGFVHGVLDKRFIDDRQHFLRHRLGCRKKAGPKTCDGEYGLANTLAH